MRLQYRPVSNGRSNDVQSSANSQPLAELDDSAGVIPANDRHCRWHEREAVDPGVSLSGAGGRRGRGHPGRPLPCPCPSAAPEEEHVVVVHGVNEVLHGVVVLQAGAGLPAASSALFVFLFRVQHMCQGRLLALRSIKAPRSGDGHHGRDGGRGGGAGTQRARQRRE